MKKKGQAKMPTAVIDLLVHIPLFDNLDPDELAVVVKSIKVVEAMKGDIVFREGDKGGSVCFVVEGTLDVLKKSEAGDYVALSTLTKGRSIGEMSLLDYFPRSATVRARVESTLLILSRPDFEQLLNNHPRIGIKLLKGVARLLSLNLRKTSSRLADYMLPVT